MSTHSFFKVEQRLNLLITKRELIFSKQKYSVKIGHGLYIGGNYLYTKFDNEYAFETPVEEEVKLNGLGLVFLWDKRDDVYYPKNGSKFNFNFTSYPEFMSNEDASSQIAIQYNQYINTNKTRDVLALRAYGGFGLGEVPFNNLIVVALLIKTPGIKKCVLQ